MRIRTLSLVLALPLVATPALAQFPPPSDVAVVDPQCSTQNIVVQDACQKAVDLFQLMAPQLGLAVTGGNATLGQGGAMGRFGRLTFAARVTAMEGRVPKVADVTPDVTGAQRSDYAVEDAPIGLPMADAAIGILPGLNVGGRRILGLDALGSVAYIPKMESDEGDFSITPDEDETKVGNGAVKFGYGARVGLVSEGTILPAIGATWLTRELPTSDLVGVTAEGDSIGLRRLASKSTAWRIVAHKNLGAFRLAVGGGQDEYESSSEMNVTVTREGVTARSSSFMLQQAMTRTNVFANLWLNLVLFKVVAEVGQVSGGDDIATYNTFGTAKPNDTLKYASLGVRFGHGGGR